MTNKTSDEILWRCVPFASLSSIEAYELMKLRVDVFVVEQNCPYSELDNKDLNSGVYQLLGYKQITNESIGDKSVKNTSKQLVACARLLEAGISYNTPSIGRVIVHADHRGSNLGHELMQVSIDQLLTLWPNASITIGAQAHLESFYASHGFKAISEPYHEDGIPHIDMQLDLD